jgi:hypothetical protein
MYFFKGIGNMFGAIGSKLAQGITSLGSKLGHWARGGEAYARIGREPVIASGRGFSYVPVKNIGESVMNNAGGFINQVVGLAPQGLRFRG